jgi:FkbM family methyltransferase
MSCTNQHYPPGTQKNNNGFALRNIIMEKGKELEFHEGPGGLESASRILMKGEPPVPPSTNVVVSRYKKDVSFVYRINGGENINVMIYEKEDPSSPLNIPLNKGQEASVYLKYIIDHYENLTDYTFFIHDDEYAWHHSGSIIDKYEEAKTQNLKYYNINDQCANCINDVLNYCNGNGWTEEYMEWYKNYIETYVPFSSLAKFDIHRNSAQFLVHRDVIRNLPLYFYQELYSWIMESDLENRKTSRFLEWTWHILWQIYPHQISKNTVRFDGFSYSTDDPVYRHFIEKGASEPYPRHLSVVQKYLKMFPHKNRTYIDVGAHIGTTILPYSRFYSEIHGYEPNTENFEYLSQNVKQLRVHPRISRTALSSISTTGKMVKHSGGNSGCFYFQQDDTGDVICETLDIEAQANSIQDIDFIKIDAEGMEVEILKGAEQTIRKYKPLIQFQTNILAKTIYGFGRRDGGADYLRELGYIDFDTSDGSNRFMYCPNETHSILPKTLYTFWTGTNEMSQNRIQCLQHLRENTGANVILIDVNNYQDYILQSEPLHPSYPYLSETHRADYLRTYFMHFFGGGYSDIKYTTGSWTNSFEEMGNTEKTICGYKEIGPFGVPVIELRQEWESLIGGGCYIAKPNTDFTKKWYSRMVKILDEKLDQIKSNPSRFPQDCSEEGGGYPLAWQEILGRVFHRVCYEERDKISMSLPILIFHSYR